MNRLMDRRDALKGIGGGLLTVGGLMGCGTQEVKQQNIKWAQGWLLWRDYKERQNPMTEAFDDLSAIGAHGIELTSQPGELERHGLTIPSVRAELEKRKLELSGRYFSAPFYDAGKKDEIMQAAQEHIDFLKALGGRNIVIGPPSVPDNTTDRIELVKMHAPMLNELGKFTMDQGVEIGIHPHLNTTIETPEEIDVIMEATDPRYVHMSADTVHIYIAGGDVVATLRKYRDRLNYFHFKDGVRPFNRPDFIPSLREMGKGEVDFPAVMHFLKEIGFKGWINIELEASPVPPRESATTSMEYVKQILMPIYT